jgi:alkanesulfonate monooxygenase SsuD/methylene tetrahydromethanopterin reductase-like flavin-dependent oxidoreductase (luciferase family)
VSNGRLQLGVSLPVWEDREGRAPGWDALRGLAVAAEAAGVDTVWVPDHLQSRPTTGFWECWTILTALSQVTDRVTLGPHVLCAGYRNPGLVARMAATLDEVSGGRLILGLGAGDPAFDASWRLYGYPSDRIVSRFAESLEVIARLFRGETVEFAGEFVTIDEATLRPRGPRAGGPPLWVAARGPRMLRLAATWADAINYEEAGATVGDFAAVSTRLDVACAEVGRDPATIARTGSVLVSFADDERAMTGPRATALRGTPEEIAAGLRAWQAAGVNHLTCWIDDGTGTTLTTAWPRLTLAGLERFAEVVRLVAGNG